MRRILFTAILVVACATDVGTPSLFLLNPVGAFAPNEHETKPGADPLRKRCRSGFELDTVVTRCAMM